MMTSKIKNVFLGLLTLVLINSCNLINSSNSSSSSVVSNGSSISISSNNILTANLLSINDTHGRLLSTGGEIGMDKVSGNIKKMEANKGEYIKIANGDIFQGTYESNVLYGRPMIDCLNEMNFDCLVIGNHEFDWGIDKIAAYKDGNLENGEANFDFLTCNIVYKESNMPLTWAEPYIIKESEGGAKVGIIGAIGEYLTSSISGSRIKDYDFLDPVPLIETYAKELRDEEKCDIVVVAIHEYERSTCERIASLTNSSRIDGIFTAHTHSKVNETAGSKKIPVLQGACNNEYLAIMNFEVENGVVRTNKVLLSNSSASSDSKINTIVNSYVNGELKTKGEEVIGYNSSYKSAAYMAQVFVNAMHEIYGGDVAISNKAREPLDQGNITIKEMYQVFPFDNMIIKAKISGEKLIGFYNYAYSIYYSEGFNINDIKANETYEIVIIDYVYDNERNTNYFSQDPSIRVEQNQYMRDFMIDYIKEKENI